ncbi:MAG: 50S ribosomal protein L4 [Eubacteriales bacterium]|nr:50S ribosomal protein L4 [Eubacteriales bacterium]
MPSVKVVNMAGKEVGSMELSEKVFGAAVNEAVLHAAVRAYLLNQRQGTQSTLTRAEVSGGGIKPWRQKGTGRARQGSTRSPQWTHGGVALGPKPRSYRVSMNKKTKRVALQSALSAKVACGEMVVVDAIAAQAYKTRVMSDMLKAIGFEKKALVVLAEKDDKVYKSLSNIEGVKIAYVNTINVYDILNCGLFVVAKAAAEKIEEVYA